MWTEEQPYYLKNTELINSKIPSSFGVTLEISGNSIIQKTNGKKFVAFCLRINILSRYNQRR